MKLNPNLDMKLEYFLKLERRKLAEDEFVRLRKDFCDFMTPLNVKILIPVCCDCYAFKVRFLELEGDFPDICANTWKEDLAWEVGLDEEEIKGAEQNIQNGDFQVVCDKCGSPLQYGYDDFYIENELFEEYFDILESNHRSPSKNLKKRMKELYGKKCYGCRKKLSKEDVSNDHIVARVHGGLTSPLNLQILCKNCDNSIKGGRKVEAVNVSLTFLFRPPPSDSFESVIW